MDPRANIARQRELAKIITEVGATRTAEGESTVGLETKGLMAAFELAELVTALDEWRTNGGFDPYASEPIIRIVFSEEDVLGMSEDAGVEADEALRRAREWGKHIADTATQLCGEQLEQAVRTDQP